MTHYQTLAVDSGASFEEIKRAYRRLVREYHPDVAGPESNEKFREIQSAYEVLADTEERRLYDMTIGVGGWGRSPRTAIPYNPAANNGFGVQQPSTSTTAKNPPTASQYKSYSTYKPRPSKPPTSKPKQPPTPKTEPKAKQAAGDRRQPPSKTTPPKQSSQAKPKNPAKPNASWVSFTTQQSKQKGSTNGRAEKQPPKSGTSSSSQKSRSSSAKTPPNPSTDEHPFDRRVQSSGYPGKATSNGKTTGRSPDPEPSPPENSSSATVGGSNSSFRSAGHYGAYTTATSSNTTNSSTNGHSKNGHSKTSNTGHNGYSSNGHSGQSGTSGKTVYVSSSQVPPQAPQSKSSQSQSPQSRPPQPPPPQPPPPPRPKPKPKSYEQLSREVQQAMQKHKYSDACELAEHLVAEHPQRSQAQRLFARAYHLRGNEMLFYKQFQLAEVYLYEAFKTASAHHPDLAETIRQDLERAEINRKELGVS